MASLRDTLGSLRMHRLRWEKLMQARAKMNAAAETGHPSHLREIIDFGTNPGELRMFTHVPPNVSAGCGLVVVLHGCQQTAAGYDLGAGWSTLAHRYGFALLLAEQQPANNPNRCFNWFLPGDMERGQGEALSIRQMVARMVSEHAVDPARIFITGLSAGGAMTAVMLATYPEVFAGGAIVGGLPYRAATCVQTAFETMFQCPPRPGPEWGDQVRRASPHRGPWPRLSVWHGGSDTTVIPPNAREICKQWTDVHGLSATPTFTETVDGYPREVWCNAAGEDVIESYTIPSMAHGTPIAVGKGDNQCGMAGAFLLDVGISSSYHIAKFWGLAVRPQAAAVSDETFAPAAPARSPVAVRQPAPAGAFARSAAADARQPIPSIQINAIIANALNAAGLTAETRAGRQINTVISNALKAAGLLKATPER
ncbi:MAG TPA: PHB depolymerase family esterase [Xanthobacteraceae bacterium]|nr:PHB depolymerase family esterase [Xanthobacteraceae bacterium]